MKNYSPTAYSIGYINTDILYSGFLASQRWSEADSLESAQDIEKPLESGKK